MTIILVENARFLITMDPERRIFRDGAIAVENGLIADVGKTEVLKRDYEHPDIRIDARRKVVTPGLIDAHCHITEQMLRGLTDGVFAPSAVPRHWLYESSLNSEEAFLASKACLIESIRCGTTHIMDPGGYHLDEAVKAVEEMGMRAILSRSLIDIHTGVQPVPEALRESTEKALAAGDEFVTKYNGYSGGRIKAWFSLRTERSTTSELGHAVKELADKRGVGVISHIAASHYWTDFHKEIFDGLTPIQRYEKAGILGPNLLAIGVNWATDEEIEMLRKHDVKVVHTPTNARLALGSLQTGRLIELIKRGITVCLGHDGAGESNSGDMVRAMYLTAVGHRDVALDPTVMTNEMVLEMATVKAARALNSEGEVGSLEPGKRADLVVWDATRVDWVPVLNPISNLVQSASGNSAETVIIDGKVVMQDQKILTADEKDILAKVEDAAKDLTERSGLSKYAASKWPMI